MAGNIREGSQRSLVGRLSLILLAFSKGGTYTVTELAEHTGIPLSTTHRLATEFTHWRVLERSDDLRFRPGPSLRALGGPGSFASSIRDRAAPVLEDLSRATGAPTRFGLLNKSTASYIDAEPGKPVSNFSRAAQLPLHATALGKVLLAFASNTTVDEVLSRRLQTYTPHTITDRQRLRWVIRLARARRAAVDDQELLIDYTAIAMPVFGVGGGVVGALEIRTDGVRSDVRSALAVAAGSLSREFERPGCDCSDGSIATAATPASLGFLTPASN